ncbi:MAG: hypothetical protein Q4E83_00435 [bacterium]|nr:hypothetical protein [bacterium]
MEIKTKLIKPYTEEQKLNFIVEQNHNNSYEIRETETALEAWGYTTEELEQQEKTRIAQLSMTGADVERAIYQAKGIDFEDILALVKSKENSEQAYNIDLKALKIELKANNFYRGNPYINQIGELLGFTSEQLDQFFETKNWQTLVNA